MLIVVQNEACLDCGLDLSINYILSSYFCSMICVTSQKFQNKENEFHLLQFSEPTKTLIKLSYVHSAQACRM